MRKILLVDVKDEIGLFLKKTQEEQGYVVLTSSSLKETRDFITNLSPDLIIFDLAISSVEVIEFLKDLKREKKTIPIIILTPYEESGRDFEFLNSDIHIVLSDEPNNLKNTIKTIFSFL